jgi:hypothetical protein
MSIRHLGLALLAVLVSVARPASAQIAGDTMALRSDPMSTVNEVAKIPPGQSDSTLLRALDPVPTVTEVLTLDTVGTTVDTAKEHYDTIKNMSKTKIKREFDLGGQAKKGEKAAAIKADAKSKSSFLGKLGSALNVVEYWSAAWTFLGYAAEKDLIGATGMATEFALKKGATSGAALVGSAAGPAGTIGAVAAAEGFHEAVVKPAIQNAEDEARVQARKNEVWGPKMATGIYSGPFGVEGRRKGTIRLTFKEGVVACTVSGIYMGGTISGRCASGTLDENGAFSVSVGGSLTFAGKEKTTTETFSGRVSGKLVEGKASGRFSTFGGGETVTGMWEAPRL